MRAFDWPAMMRAGMLGLGLKPAEFWALTPAELRLMLGQTGAAEPLNRAGLDALLAAYPDHAKGCENGGSGRDRST
ncbi:rcc01693 family protein [Marinibacterium profundimaris]|nr:rcc01693 family protein [Marinibacterium profundimaris]